MNPVAGSRAFGGSCLGEEVPTTVISTRRAPPPMSALPSPAGAPRPTRSPIRRGYLIGIGLLFTIVGVALLSLFLPTNSASYTHIVPIAIGVFVCLWVGGILLGRSRGAPP